MNAVNKVWFEQAMRGRGFSLRGLAGAMGIDPSALSRALNSTRKFKPAEIEQLATLLQRSPAEILMQVNQSSETQGGFSEVTQQKFQHEPVPKASGEKQPFRHPAWGALKGMITIPPGVDLTEPTYADWKALYGEDK